jgi:hypothetical protein
VRLCVAAAISCARRPAAERIDVLVAEAFRCCHDVTPSMRVSAPVTLPKPSDTPARKPYKARGRPASGLPDPHAMPGQAATTAIYLPASTTVAPSAETIVE